ncbi:hypothetical protein [Hydrogenophaga sp. 2FB]|uniref:hypothetical protein n=1 Tax=Hydrogenophaga sp. 2FB TaxID=2502187 RepID=UPI0010F7C85F|nr:hypothetical protein [Hydrogenophaga sp. 2FB]
MVHQAKFVIPTQEEICEVLKLHPLVKLREKVSRCFLVGSFAAEHLGVGATHERSDVDVLIEVEAREQSASDLDEHYRKRLAQYFVTHGIRGVADHVHPQWCGRRVDVYFTFDATPEQRPKIELERLAPKARMRP